MAAILINGKVIQKDILEEIAAEMAEIKAKTGAVPGLATLLVGDQPALGILCYRQNKNGEKAWFQGDSRPPSEGCFGGGTTLPHKWLQQR